MPTPDFGMTSQNWLLEELEHLRLKNPRYSLRAMAQRLGMSPGRLSEVMNGRRGLTRKTAEKIADRLDYDPKRRALFLATVERTNQTRSSSSATDPAPLKSIQPPKYDKIDIDSFHVVADWYHFAILSLMELNDFDPSPKWISSRLGITITQCEQAMERLKRTGLIEENKENGRLRSTGRNIETPTDIASSALKRSHRQTLEQAIQSLYDIPVEDRDITSMTMAISSKKLPEAKKLIREFRKKLAAFLEEGKADEVYNLNIQLVPVTVLKESKK